MIPGANLHRGIEPGRFLCLSDFFEGEQGQW